jgi:tetratricopeptide (TPR) repeat protein
MVTSRKTLTALTTRHGARHLHLTILGQDEAHALLADRLGHPRVAAEPDAVGELVGLCGRYPLALALMASRANALPHIPLAEFAAELRELGLEALEDADPAASLPAVLSWSLRRLTDQQRTVFKLLGIAPGPDISLPTAVSLTGLPEPQVRKALRELAEASLLDRLPGGRYSMHDLVRAYAADTARQHLPEGAREAALRRVVDFCAHTAFAADRLLNPHRPPIRLDPPTPGCLPRPLPDDTAALTWFDTEHPCLLAAQHTAATHGWHQAVLHLAWALNTFHARRGHRHDRLAVWRAGLAAAEHLPDPTIRAYAHRHLGKTYTILGRLDEAIEHLRQALALAEQHHDHTAQAQVHYSLALAWERRGDHRWALEHATHALTLYRALDDPVREARVLNAVGLQTARLGDYEQARTHCQAALAVHRHHHNPYGAAAALDSLGYIDHHTGRHHQAIEHYEQALTLLRDLGHTHAAATTLDNLGHPHTALGQHGQARAVWREAVELYQAQGRTEDAERVQGQLDALDRHPADRSTTKLEF